MVLAIVGALWALLLSRLEDTSRLAQRAQLKMAIEQVNLQERLLQLRCGAALMPDCWRQWLSERRAVPGEPDRPDLPMPPMLPLAPDAASRLQVLALAAGLHQAPQQKRAYLATAVVAGAEASGSLARAPDVPLRRRSAARRQCAGQAAVRLLNRRLAP